MRRLLQALTAAFTLFVCHPAFAAEGLTIAGPIGGNDIRSANLPPPGLYGGFLAVGSPAFDFVDDNGNTVPALRTIDLVKYVGGPFLWYVPDVKVASGHVSIGGIVPIGGLCGHLFVNEPDTCDGGVGDPYVEMNWSRTFAKPRASRFDGALPILEGLTVMAGLGIVIPVGRYDPTDASTQAHSIGTNIWDFAPTIGVTYTTRPILAEGTEFSAKLYWNNYLTNEDTDYATGSVINIDFAISERIGRFQVGLAGSYIDQVGDDKLSGVVVPPDGRHAESLNIGSIVNYDMPERNAAMKVKTLFTVHAENTVRFWGASLGWIKKF